MARSKHTPISRPSDIVPQARPVNTYVRPADPAPSSLHDVARGLAAFDKGLSKFLSARQAKADQTASLQAQFSVLTGQEGPVPLVGDTETGRGELLGVKLGVIPAGESDTFKQRTWQEEGNLDGIRLRDAFSSAYQTWDGRNSDDPAVFQKFVQEFFASNVTRREEAYLRGVLPHMAAITEDGYTAHRNPRKPSAPAQLDHGGGLQ